MADVPEEDGAIRYLQDVAQSRMRLFATTSDRERDAAGNEIPPPQTVLGMAVAVKHLLTEVIPAVPEYAELRLSALMSIASLKLDHLGPEGDKTEIDNVIDKIHGQQIGLAQRMVAGVIYAADNKSRNSLENSLPPDELPARLTRTSVVKIGKYIQHYRDIARQFPGEKAIVQSARGRHVGEWGSRLSGVPEDIVAVVRDNPKLKEKWEPGVGDMAIRVIDCLDSLIAPQEDKTVGRDALLQVLIRDRSGWRSIRLSHLLEAEDAARLEEKLSDIGELVGALDDYYEAWTASARQVSPGVRLGGRRMDGVLLEGSPRAKGTIMSQAPGLKRSLEQDPGTKRLRLNLRESIQLRSDPSSLTNLQSPPDQMNQLSELSNLPSDTIPEPQHGMQKSEAGRGEAEAHSVRSGTGPDILLERSPVGSQDEYLLPDLPEGELAEINQALDELESEEAAQLKRTRKSEGSAVGYLQETVRRRSLTFTPPDKQQAPERAPPDPKTEKGLLEQRINDILTSRIPDGSEFNNQRLYALRAIIPRHLDPLNMESREQEVASLIKDIHERCSQSKGSVRDETVVELYGLLVSYSSWGEKIDSSRNVDPRQFPHIEVLGFRRDEPELEADIGGSYKIPSDYQRRRDQLARIDELLNEIVPVGAHYNVLRQSIVDKISTGGIAVSRWQARQSEIAKERNETGNEDWIPNSYFHWKKEFMNSLQKEINRFNNRFPPTGRQPSPLTPKEVIEISEALQSHYTLTSSAAQPALKRMFAIPSGRAEGVHKDINSVVRRELPRWAHTNAVAEVMATRVAEKLDDVIAPHRGNFRRRAWLLKTVSDNRDYWLKPQQVDVAQRQELLTLLASGYSRTFKEKPAQIQQLVKTIDGYHRAWRGELKELPPAVQPIRASVAKTKLQSGKAAGRLGKDGSSKLEAGQRTLNFQPISKSGSASDRQLKPLDSEGGNNRNASELAAPVKRLQPEGQSPADDRVPDEKRARYDRDRENGSRCL